MLAMRGWKQPELARRSGFKSQSNITGLLNNNKNGIRMDNFFRMVSAMGFEIIIRDTMGSGKEFTIDMKEEEE